MPLAMLALWLPDLDLPLGNSDDGRLVAFSGLHARSFWELGPLESRLGARVDPYVRPEFGVAPRTEPPVEAVTYAHHPPLKEFLSIGSAGLLGENLPALRVPIFLMGAATLLFMASLLRACDVRWGPIILAIGSMACTGFFYVYGRLGVSFSLLVASTAAVAWLLKRERASRLALAGTAVLAALTAMQSWINLASLALLAAWLFGAHLRRGHEETAGSTEPGSGPWRRLRQGWSPTLSWFVVGACVGAAITAAWMLYATGVAELSEQVGLRVGNEVTSGGQPVTFTFGEFLSRQWRFATEELLVPPWLRLLLIPALLAGLIDRRTRIPAAITLAVAAALTFGVQQGAWVHRIWNFPWTVPVTIGVAALVDAVRRWLPSRVRGAAALAAGAVIAMTMFLVVNGSTRDRYITDPAQVGEALEQVVDSPQAAGAELAWVGPGLPAPRWVAYYLDVPVWQLDESRLQHIDGSDIVIVRASRVPDYFPADTLADPLASVGDFLVISAGSLTH